MYCCLSSKSWWILVPHIWILSRALYYNHELFVRSRLGYGFDVFAKPGASKFIILKYYRCDSLILLCLQKSTPSKVLLGICFQGICLLPLRMQMLSILLCCYPQPFEFCLGHLVLIPRPSHSRSSPLYLAWYRPNDRFDLTAVSS